VKRVDWANGAIELQMTVKNLQKLLSFLIRKSKEVFFESNTEKNTKEVILEF
jgi:hypothetical protein